MNTIAMIMGAMMTAGSAPVSADHQLIAQREARALAAFSVAAARIEMVAVTRRARADTALRRAHLQESLNMSKVMPGYPQPAFVSLDFRIKF